MGFWKHRGTTFMAIWQFARDLKVFINFTSVILVLENSMEKSEIELLYFSQ